MIQFVTAFEQKDEEINETPFFDNQINGIIVN